MYELVEVPISKQIITLIANEFLKKSVVYSIQELEEAKEQGLFMTLLYNQQKELMGYAIQRPVNLNYLYEQSVEQEFFYNPSSSTYILIDVIELKPQFQRKGYASHYIEQIQQKSDLPIIILAARGTKETFWNPLGFHHVTEKSPWMVWTPIGVAPKRHVQVV